MENPDRGDDVDDVSKDSLGNDDERRAPSGGEALRTADLKEANIKKDDFAEEFPSELLMPNATMSSAPSDPHPFPSVRVTSASNGNFDDCGTEVLEHAAPPDEPPYASLPSASKSKSTFDDNNDRAFARDSAGGKKLLELAPPGEPVPSPGLRILDSSERPPDFAASNLEVAPGAFPVIPSSPNSATSRTFRSPISSYDSARAFANEESKQENDTAGASAIEHDSSREATESGLYAVEAQLAPDTRKEGEVTMTVAEGQYVRVKWYQRPLYWWIFACGLAVAVVVLVVVFVVRPPSAAKSSSLTPPTRAPTSKPPPTPAPTSMPTPTPAPTSKPRPTPAPTLLTPELIACNFLSIPNVTRCRSTFKFDSYNDANDKTNDSTIPSEIRLLTQLTYLDFSFNSLTSSIPSEVGLLTQLEFLSFYDNSLTSSIPSEIGLLTQLTELYSSYNSLIGTIPSEIGLLTQLTLLGFYHNSLTSSIPSEIGLLTQLTLLDFYNNALIGTIPSSLCSLPSPPHICIDYGITCASGCCNC